MGQCVSRKAGAVIAASGHHDSPSYRIMDKFGKNQNDHKGAAKRGVSYTRGTAMSFGFRRRPTSGIPMPIPNYSSTAETTLLHPRSKSAGAEQERRRGAKDDDDTMIHNSSSGRSTPRLAPPKKESSGIAVRTNRFGYRQPQKYTNKVADICSSHSVSHYNQEKIQQQHQPESYKQQSTGNRVVQVYNVSSKSRPVNAAPNYASPAYNTNHNIGNANGNLDTNRRVSGIAEPVSRYTLHTSHLPLPQYAVRMNDTNSKTAKTAANQSRKVSTASKGSASSKEGSGTEDSGIGSQQGCPGEDNRIGMRSSPAMDYDRRSIGKPRNLRMVVNGKSFDVRDVHDDDSTVTEISVIPLPKSFGSVNLNTGLVRERTSQYQRIVNKDNRYTDSTTSMSTTSSEGYDEGLGEEKVYKDRSHSEKIPSMKSDFSPPSSDDPEYGHGEAMADEYSLSSSDECHQRSAASNSSQHLQTISNVAKNGALPKSTLRSVLLTIEDPAFAAAAATSTTLIDDETSPVDSLFDSPTASITQSDGKISKKEHQDDERDEVMTRSGNTIDDDSPGTPTNASNSLNLSEGREFFDDEIADQPGLIFDDTTSRGAVGENHSAIASQVVTENTLVESNSKTNVAHSKGGVNSPLHGRRISRAGSVDTLSPCESIASDDLMLDYERSDTSSYEEHHRLDSNPALHELDDTTILSELVAQGEEVMRQWTSLLGTSQLQQQINTNNTNNNINAGVNNNNNNNNHAESGIAIDRTTRVLRSRSGTDSPRSLDSSMRNRQVPSPLRTSRNIQSPSLDSGDEGSLKIERGTYQYMFQDIVSIKTMLLKLKQVLQETETLNPFDNSVKNGLFCNLNEGGTVDVSTSPDSEGGSIPDELADLRRQVVYLQGQVKDRDRIIQMSQYEISRLQGPHGYGAQNGTLSIGKVSHIDTCNAATQTEKTRPVSAGPSLLQSLPQDGVMGPLVSWSDSWDRQRPSPDLNSSRNLCKLIDRLSRSTRTPRQDKTSHRQNGHVESYEKGSQRGGRSKESVDTTNDEAKSRAKQEVIKQETKEETKGNCFP